jgi:hypothetical protein
VRVLRSRWFWLLPIAAAAAVLVVLLSSDDDGADSASTGGQELPVDAPAPPSVDKDGAGGGGGGAESGPDEESAARRAVRGYVEAVDDRDGARVCAMLAPGAIQGFQLPRERGGCAASLRASIGYRDPRGFPVFSSARLDSIGDVSLGEGEARVTATVVTEFADRNQPSIEEDLIYLVDIDGEWRVAKPSSSLYRAVGKPEVPPEAIAPPTE